QDAMEVLQNYEWPGNIRELSNFITRIVTFADSTRSVITAADLPFSNHAARSSVPEKAMKPADLGRQENQVESYLQKWTNEILAVFKQKEGFSLEDVLLQIKTLESQVGKAFILQTLKDAHGNRKEAAKRLQITMRKLRYLLNEKKGSPEFQNIK
ncbi:MAG: helix-turn-helix domain-containing protein, partial [Bacillota bacterium]|nr:helix-turn-helix domain-containing protein [Bacillota bacterium]